MLWNDYASQDGNEITEDGLFERFAEPLDIWHGSCGNKRKGEKENENHISCCIQTAASDCSGKKDCGRILQKFKKRSGVSLLQSKTSGKISIEFYKEDSCSEEVKALFDGITVPGKETSDQVIDNPDGSGRIVVLGKDERGEFYRMARLLRKAIVKKGRH